MLPEQTGFSEAVIITLAGRPLFLTRLIGLEVKGFGTPHDKPEVTCRVTKSPSAGIYEYVALVAAGTGGTPFTSHWYPGGVGGVPPFVTVELKLMGKPWQNGFGFVPVIKIVATTFNESLTSIVISLEVFGFPFTHIRLEVRAQDILSLLAGVYTSTGLTLTRTPFFFH